MFGKDIRFYDETDETVCVKANVNESAMIQFAKSYAPDVVILEPERLREQIAHELENGLNEYKIEEV